MKSLTNSTERPALFSRAAGRFRVFTMVAKSLPKTFGE